MPKTNYHMSVYFLENCSNSPYFYIGLRFLSHLNTDLDFCRIWSIFKFDQTLKGPIYLSNPIFLSPLPPMSDHRHLSLTLPSFIFPIIVRGQSLSSMSIPTPQSQSLSQPFDRDLVIDDRDCNLGLSIMISQSTSLL